MVKNWPLAIRYSEIKLFEDKRFLKSQFSHDVNHFSMKLVIFRSQSDFKFEIGIFWERFQTLDLFVVTSK